MPPLPPSPGAGGGLQEPKTSEAPPLLLLRPWAPGAPGGTPPAAPSPPSGSQTNAPERGADLQQGEQDRGSWFVILFLDNVMPEYMVDFDAPQKKRRKPWRFG